MSKKSDRGSLSLRKQYLYSLVVSFGCVCAGTVLGWTSPVLPQLKNVVSESQGGILGSIVAIGAMAAALPAGYIAAKIGCKTTLKYLAGPFFVGWIVLGIVDDLKLLYLARLIGGIASGAVCVCVPMYVGDIASVSVRGILGSFFQISFCAGILLVNLIGAFTTWRDLSLLLAIPPVIYFTGLFFIPETENRRSVVHCEEQQSVLQTLKQGKNAHALKVALGLVTFQQLSGVNAVIFYTAGIFAASGSSISANTCAVVVAGVQMAFSIISASLIEKLNRRIYLIISSLGMCCSLLLLGAYFHSQQLDMNIPALNYIPLISLVMFIISFCFGYGPIPWLMMGELFAPEFKGLGCGIATMFNWVLIFAVTCFFPIICANLGGHATFYLFSAFNLCASIFTLYCVPETRGKTISEIQISL